MRKIVILIFIITLGLSVNAYADNEAAVQGKCRVVFAVDSSNSMNYNDKANMTGEVIKMLLDFCDSGKTEAAVVFYNDDVLSNTGLNMISDKKEEYKKSVSDFGKKGSTDIGLALKTSVDLFGSIDENDICSVILFSDGETDLSVSGTGRTLADSKNDEVYAVNKSKESNIKIYTVCLNKNNKSDYLKNISEQTGGKTYSLKELSDVSSMFTDLAANVTRNKISEVPVSSEGGNYKFTVGLLKGYARETDIIIQHLKPVNNLNTDYGEENFESYSSNLYTILKLKNSDKDSINVSFSAENSNIKVSAVNYIKIFPRVDMPENTALLNLPIEVRLADVDTGNEAGKEFYENLKGEIEIIDEDSGEVQRAALGNAGDYMTATIQNTNPKTYKFKAEVYNDIYRENSPYKEIILTNNPPEQKEDNKISVLKGSETEIDLNDYFYDNDGDALTYQFADKKYSENKNIDKNMLKVFSEEDKIESIVLNVSDGRGGVISGDIILEYMPLWLYYKNTIIGVILIFILLLTLYLIYKYKTSEKKEEPEEVPHKTGEIFTGARFEGYFLKTLSGNDIPVLNWNASYIDNRHNITLGEMFGILDVTEKLPEANKIFFEAGKNNTVIFYHDTDCIISFGNRNILRKKKEVLNYDDRIYIVFEDNSTEIEIRYKRVRKNNKSYV